jgi:TonB family protein
MKSKTESSFVKILETDSLYILLLIILTTIVGCSTSRDFQRAPKPNYEVIEIDAIKPPNLTLSGDSAFYSEDSLLYKVNHYRNTFATSDTEWVPVGKSPSPLRIVNPKCPSEARTNSIVGSTRVKMMIDSLGIPRKARIVESSNKIFNECSLIAAMQWRFSPAMTKGQQPVSVWVDIPFRFRDCH